MKLPESIKGLSKVYLNYEEIASLTGEVEKSTAETNSRSSAVRLNAANTFETSRTQETDCGQQIRWKLTDSGAYDILLEKSESGECDYVYGKLELSLDSEENEGLAENKLTDEIKGEALRVDETCRMSILDDHGTRYLGPGVFAFVNKTDEATVRVYGVFMVKPAPKKNPEDSGERVCPLNVMGLDQLLFPGKANREKGFILPKGEAVIPRVFVIKGAPGTGKTVLATQMMAGFSQSKHNVSCVYCHTDSSKAVIRETAASFRFFEHRTPLSDQLSVEIRNKREALAIVTKNVKRAEIQRDLENLEAQLSHELLEANRKAFTAAENSGRIKIVDDLGRNYERYMTDERFIEDTFKDVDVVFFDSLNISLLIKYHRWRRAIGQVAVRDILHDIFSPHRKADRLVFFLVEDYGSEATEEMRQYIADCEFLADSVIQLSEIYRHDYRTWSLKIKKKHFGAQTYGEHIYKICSPNHALSNVFNDKSGIVVFPSIHSYLSGAREAFESFGHDKYVGTGITHLDAIFSGDKMPSEKAAMSMPPDATVVVRGMKGSHKLPLGINILLGGMWSPQFAKDRCSEQEPKDVLIILLDEESNINLARTAIAENTELLTDMALPDKVKSLDNAQWLSDPSEQCIYKDKSCDLKDLCGTYINSGKKVFFRRTCFKVKDASGRKHQCRKAVIAGFRPGCITPEEFLNIIKKLVRPDPDKTTVFSRVLFVSTAHLHMRFPLLDSEKLFLPALIDVFKSERILSIIIDIEGEGSDKELSYGLSSLADYLITLRPLVRGDRQGFLPYTSKSSPEALELIRKLRHEYGSSREGFAWSEMDIENVRGKEYSKSSHAVTVLGHEDGHHSLHLVNLERKQKKQRLYDRITIPGVEIVNKKGVALPVTCLNISPSGMRLKHSDPTYLKGISNILVKKGTVKGGPVSLHTRWTRKTGEEYETGYELVSGSLIPFCDPSHTAS